MSSARLSRGLVTHDRPSMGVAATSARQSTSRSCASAALSGPSAVRLRRTVRRRHLRGLSLVPWLAGMVAACSGPQHNALICPNGQHDGGRGACVPVGACAGGYFDDGAGTCIAPQTGSGVTDAFITARRGLPIDMVFMIDNSPASMAPKVDKMNAQFPKLIDALRDPTDQTLPDLRIALIDSDLGTGCAFSSGSCGPKMSNSGRGCLGDQGRFQMLASPVPCAFAPGAEFLEYRQGVPVNYTGDINTVFACLAGNLGSQGCGLQSQLQAFEFALAAKGLGNEQQQADFLRAAVSAGRNLAAHSLPHLRRFRRRWLRLVLPDRRSPVEADAGFRAGRWNKGHLPVGGPRPDRSGEVPDNAESLNYVAPRPRTQAISGVLQMRDEMSGMSWLAAGLTCSLGNASPSPLVAPGQEGEEHDESCKWHRMRRPAQRTRAAGAGRPCRRGGGPRVTSPRGTPRGTPHRRWLSTSPVRRASAGRVAARRAATTRWDAARGDGPAR
jgi:hypothetical protein